MPVAAVIGKAVGGKVLGSVVGAIGGRKAAKSSNRRGDALSAEAAASAKNLQATAKKLESRGNDRWNFYKEHGENVDVMLIDDAVQLYKETFTGGSERAAARAAEDVAAAFDRSAEVRRRAALRFGGVDPTSGKFQGLERQVETARATTEAAARFQARRSEEDRARDTLKSASDIGRRGIEDARLSSATAASAERSAASIFAGQVPDARSEAAGSAALVGDIAGRIPFENIFSSSGESSGVVDSGGQSGDSKVSQMQSLSKIKGYRDGGVIPSDGRRGGMLKGPGNGRSDSIKAVVDGTNRPVRLSAGEFIIPAHVVRKKGERFFNKMIRR